MWPRLGSFVPGPIEPATKRGAAVGGVAVGDLAGDARGGDVELVGAVGDVVLGEHRAEAAEAGRLHGIDADVEEGGVHAGDDVGPGEAQDLVAALERLPAEVVGREVETLHVGAEGAVEDDDALVHRLEVGLRSHWTQHATGAVATGGWRFRRAGVRLVAGEDGAGRRHRVRPDDEVLGDGVDVAEAALQRAVEVERAAAAGAVGGVDDGGGASRRPHRRAARTRARSSSVGSSPSTAIAHNDAAAS